MTRCDSARATWSVGAGRSAAAGLSMKPENVPAFTEAFAAVGPIGALADIYQSADGRGRAGPRAGA